ncbi:hypothetical protein Mal4_25150 [Maioricimonas rarisocia]|uniref:Cell division protein FtsQ n=1 Tax=Maioricimonas rarisocia TaxID=2528026 RepID=A0A517Z6Y6_9PLAN|nr:hypothetical protein [Maioricimonas rarisocia]QDU38191.1 hypothetical protein Mal4_25150 [Maioricimonas rarisocia]
MAKAKRSTKPRKPASPSRMARLGKLLLAAYRPKAICLIAVAIAAGFFTPYLLRHLPHLASQPEFALDPANVVVSEPHDWVPEEFVQTVLEGAGLAEGKSLLDGDLARNLAEAFAREAWVEEVGRVEIGRDRRVRIDLKYRSPALMVETSRGDYPVDSTGVLLPPEDFQPIDRHRFPRVRNIQSLPHGAPGTVWRDPAVSGAARLAAYLAPGGDMTRWKRFELAAIIAPDDPDQAGNPNRIPFELVTLGGRRIAWGHAPGADSLEPSPDQKVGRLEEYLRRLGSFEEPQGPYLIDIRHFDATISLQRIDQADADSDSPRQR